MIFFWYHSMDPIFDIDKNCRKKFQLRVIQSVQTQYSRVRLASLLPSKPESTAVIILKGEKFRTNF